MVEMRIHFVVDEEGQWWAAGNDENNAPDVEYVQEKARENAIGEVRFGVIHACVEKPGPTPALKVEGVEVKS